MLFPVYLILRLLNVSYLIPSFIFLFYLTFNYKFLLECSVNFETLLYLYAFSFLWLMLSFLSVKIRVLLKFFVVFKDYYYFSDKSSLFISIYDLNISFYFEIRFDSWVFLVFWLVLYLISSSIENSNFLSFINSFIFILLSLIVLSNS